MTGTHSVPKASAPNRALRAATCWWLPCWSPCWRMSRTASDPTSRQKTELLESFACLSGQWQPYHTQHSHCPRNPYDLWKRQLDYIKHQQTPAYLQCHPRAAQNKELRASPREVLLVYVGGSHYNCCAAQVHWRLDRRGMGSALCCMRLAHSLMSLGCASWSGA